MYTADSPRPVGKSFTPANAGSSTPVSAGSSAFGGHKMTMNEQGFDRIDHALLGYFGSNRVLTHFTERLYRFFKISGADALDPACQDAVLYAAQLCLRYGLVPGLHVYVARRGKEWIADTRVRAWLDCANQFVMMTGHTYALDVVELTSDEVRQYTPANIRYTHSDIGFCARALRRCDRDDLATVGREYNPLWHFGFWRAESFKEYDATSNTWGEEWLPDPIWTGRTPADTALNRAKKAALMATFSLIPLRSALNPNYMLADLDSEIKESTRPVTPVERALFSDKEVRREEDGDVVFA